MTTEHARPDCRHRRDAHLHPRVRPCPSGIDLRVVAKPNHPPPTDDELRTAGCADQNISPAGHSNVLPALAKLDGTTLLCERAVLGGMTIPGRKSAGGAAFYLRRWTTMRGRSKGWPLPPSTRHWLLTQRSSATRPRGGAPA